jgi:hypothetical protein
MESYFLKNNKYEEITVKACYSTMFCPSPIFALMQGNSKLKLFSFSLRISPSHWQVMGLLFRRKTIGSNLVACTGTLFFAGMHLFLTNTVFFCQM